MAGEERAKELGWVKASEKKERPSRGQKSESMARGGQKEEITGKCRLAWRRRDAHSFELGRKPLTRTQNKNKGTQKSN